MSEPADACGVAFGYHALRKVADGHPVSLSPERTAHPLHRLIHPRSVAIIGASEDPAKFGGRVMKFLLMHGYAGDIYPVNARAATVAGRPAFPTIRAAPAGIDVALLAVPTEQIRPVLQQCADAGVGACVILTAGFAEADAEGAARERDLVTIARAAHMRLVGPNCLGYINPGLRLALTSSVALAAPPMPAGTLGLISQSGSLMAALISHAQDLGTGFSAAVSVGNQADLEICDFIEYFLADPLTRAICVYAEGIKEVSRFVTLAAQCRAAGKPLLVVKAGSSEAGSSIALSHTASVAGSAAVWAAVCEQHAIVSLDDAEGLIHCADFLARYGAPDGDAVAALSPSGGTIALTADRLAHAGLRLAALTPSTEFALRSFIPGARLLNPLDVGGLARESALEAAQRSYCILAEDPSVSAILIVVATTPELDVKVRVWAEQALAQRKPTVILLTPGALVNGARDILRELRCPFVNRMDDALRVLRAAIDYGSALRAQEPPAKAPPWVSALDVPTTAARQLTEHEAKALIARAGIPTTRPLLARSEAAALAAASKIGFPVVVKLSSRSITHKSEVGGVMLDIGNDAALLAAWRSVVAATPGEEAPECLIETMDSDRGFEIIVGARWDPQFGAAVIVGAGGIWVETLRDTRTSLAPVSQERALLMLRGLRIWPLLAGERQQPAADIDTLADAIVRVSWLAAHLGSRLCELDINPLLVKRAGLGVIALDARATLNPKTDLEET